MIGCSYFDLSEHIQVGCIIHLRHIVERKKSASKIPSGLVYVDTTTRFPKIYNKKDNEFHIHFMLILFRNYLLITKSLKKEMLFNHFFGRSIGFDHLISFLTLIVVRLHMNYVLI